MPRTSRHYRLPEETLDMIEAIRDVDESTTGIRPDATAVVELAIAELGRRKLGRRFADRVPVRRRRAP
jgi:hypothetical protein